MRKALVEKFAGLSVEVASALKSNKSVPFVVVRGFADDANLKKTPLYDFHVKQGGELSTRDRKSRVNARILVHASLGPFQ